MDAIETFKDEATGIVATVEIDPFEHESPRDHDCNAWTIFTNLGPHWHDIDEQLDPDECYDDCEWCKGEGEIIDPDTNEPTNCGGCGGHGQEQIDPAEYLRREHKAELVVPVYRYEHGLVSFSASTGGNPYNCEWDSGMCGLAILTADNLKTEFGGDKDKAEECLNAELETYTDWCNGSIYAYVVQDAEGETLDSCCGFYGLDHCEEEAKEALSYAVEQAHKETELVRYWAERDVETV